ncbi:TauD/TfdA family dioxygenase [Alkalihalobacillus sp. MEB130]|uniref:TauD/TfdA family dioxygenase n=1 Tax=Alkalihalobacillus sp. MEB130 TaxID=2976704 RepID=UPI0028DFC98D|nr:TauD/TfdA family dioxygenase [Alkalihalobacillus sp. MEB130]MDT8860734.1 TauD/TfdA family dioxygenase [Alkalihalobacillus sp. MEB130]
MTSILREKIVGPTAWKGIELSKDDSWVYYLTPKMIMALEEALRFVQQKGLKAPNFKKKDFPISNLSAEVSYFVNELENGKGFLVIRGLPIEKYTDEEVSIIYYGLGLHMGIPVTQNEKGELLGHVTNIGNTSNKNVRVYQTNTHLPFHTDLSDVVGLLSLRKAKSGGLSSLVSAVTVYNEILEKYPEYLGLLYRPIYFDHLGEKMPALSPIFSYYNRKLSCRYMRGYIESGHEKRGLELSKVEIEALDVIDSILHDENIRMDMMLEPGDIQFANNYTVLHSRTFFEDYEEPERKRHLLRLWLAMPNGRELASNFSRRRGIPLRT